jgi:hypothetical protein
VGRRRVVSYRVIFCGSRNWRSWHPILNAMLELATEHPDMVVIHGGARGADEMVDNYAHKLGLTVEAFPADWQGRGRAAGPIRNRQMLDAGVDEVVAFKDDFDYSLKTGGTENMVKIATQAGIPTRVLTS